MHHSRRALLVVVFANDGIYTAHIMYITESIAALTKLMCAVIILLRRTQLLMRYANDE